MVFMQRGTDDNSMSQNEILILRGVKQLNSGKLGGVDRVNNRERMDILIMRKKQRDGKALEQWLIAQNTQKNMTAQHIYDTVGERRRESNAS